MSSQQKRVDFLTDYVIYAVAIYLAKYDLDWLSVRRIIVSLIGALIATILYALLKPFVDAHKEKLKKKREARKNAQNSE